MMEARPGGIKVFAVEGSPYMRWVASRWNLRMGASMYRRALLHALSRVAGVIDAITICG